MKTRLRSSELDVHRILDGPVRINSAYGPITVPNGHFIVNFPGEFELSAALPPDAFVEMFDLSDDQRTEFGLPLEDDEESHLIGDTNPLTKITPTSTGPDAVIGVGGDYPPDRPDTLPQSPVAGSSIGPASTTPVGVTPPTDAQISAWVDAHYAERYRDRVNERLTGNRTRAAQLLDTYPVASATTNEAPAPEAVIAAGALPADAPTATPDQTATTDENPPVVMAGTIPVEPDAPVEETAGPEPTGPPADETGEGSFPFPTAEPGVEATTQIPAPESPELSAPNPDAQNVPPEQQPDGASDDDIAPPPEQV